MVSFEWIKWVLFTQQEQQFIRIEAESLSPIGAIVQLGIHLAPPYLPLIMVWYRRDRGYKDILLLFFRRYTQGIW